jgi:hypothetical protein
LQVYDHAVAVTALGVAPASVVETITRSLTAVKFPPLG